MGSGKSTVGRQLADYLGLQFTDLDTIIEQAHDRSIDAIFAEEGEIAFRNLEARALRELSKRDGLVIGTGGGTPCYHDNMKFIKESGQSIYLKMSAKDLYKRLLLLKDSRPLIAHLNDVELKEYIDEELNRREAYYMQADLITNLSPNTLL